MPSTTAQQYLTIEKTPHYFIDRQTPSRIQRLFPQMKVIIILRDPITRAISDYVQLKYHHRYYPSFDDIIDRENFTQWTPIDIGCYTKYIRRWLNYFPREQIHFVDGENLIRRPWQELAYVQRFLNISLDIDENHFYFNSHKHGFPCVRQPNGCLGVDKGRSHPSISIETRKKLEQFYVQCNAQLKQLARINFSWIDNQ
jgi:hypothetical protein